MTRTPDDLDVIRDSLGLVEAVHCGDLEGARVLLDNGNNRLMAAWLGRLAADLVEGLAESPAEMFAWLRDRHVT